MMQYILDENDNPVPEPDLYKWGMWMETADRKVTQDLINDVTVSTVFLGIDHSWQYTDNHTPILYETMIFGGEHDQYQERYATKEEALIGHQEAVKLVNK